ncbi:hypothetical protein HYU11_05135 [Candidatus Woesearchaeota archaeon]|nr:hypothetical protein [Candidatus Woesearchaeota archaeon]
MGLAKLVAVAVMVATIGSTTAFVASEVTKPTITSQQYICVSEGISRKVVYYSNGKSTPNGIQADERCNGYETHYR